MTIAWRDGQPYSTQYDDIYFSTDNGLLESNYVFIAGNQLFARWQMHSNARFTIIETGFGTGLNFISVCEKWLSFCSKTPKRSCLTLHFMSVEKHPLSEHDIAIALQAWPSVSVITQVFLAKYAEALTTQQPVALFDGLVHLTILHGDATDCLNQLHSKADAWFLDGFAPSKNPDMWSPALFQTMARMSMPGTTFATFTSAGIVKRGLSAAGFTVRKQTGFGKKREMLIGTFIDTQVVV